MFRIQTATRVAALFVVLTAVAFAADEVESNEPLTATTGFERMVALEGTWTGESITVPVGKSKEEGAKSDTTVTYEAIANDTSVIATYAKDTPMEMVSMFHMDGPDTLIHTHYCAVGNQPSMKYVPSQNANEIVFKFTGGTNMDVNKDGHVHDATVKFVDEDTVETETIIWSEGKHAYTRYATLTRQE
jgi:hypothetical protein